MNKTVAKNEEEARAWFESTIKGLDWKKPHAFMAKRYHPKRSSGANAVYWAWMSGLESYTGNDKNICHEYYKRKFLPWGEITLSNSDTIFLPGHTPEQDSSEFWVYMNKIHLHAIDEFGYVLPYPDDPGFDDFMLTYRNVKF